MKVLILGGTRFVGRHLVDALVAGGHGITVFHRGADGCAGDPRAEHVHGDRERDLAMLANRTWDAVVDTFGYVPRTVGMSARALAGAVERYVFISTISVYRKFRAGMPENDDVARLEDPAAEEITAGTYGGLKALCEEAVEGALPGRALHVRAGLIVGPHDTTDRFTYWVRRLSTGGEVLIPEPSGRMVQMIHAGDLAAWIVRMLEAGGAGVYHATGPDAPWTLEGVLEACREVSGSRVAWVPVPDAFLLEQGVAFWQELPLCLPRDEGAVLHVNVEKAVRDGLAWRPLLVTARDTLAWDARRPAGTQLKAGLTSARETALVRAWKEQAGSGSPTGPGRLVPE